MNKREISELLTRVGICPSYKGYPCLVHAIWLAASDSTPFILIKKIYADTAAHFGMSADSVQHGIRTLLEAFWNQKDSRKYFYNIVGYPVHDPLPPKEFIAVVTDYIQRRQNRH